MLVRIKVSSGLVQHASPNPILTQISPSQLTIYSTSSIPSVVLRSPLPPLGFIAVANQVLSILLSSVLFKRFLIAVREPEGSSFARHINLQLTYSFQNNAQNPMHGMNGSKGSLYPAHGEPNSAPP